MNAHTLSLGFHPVKAFPPRQDPKTKGEPFGGQDQSRLSWGEPPPRSGLLGALPLWGPALPPLRAAGLLLRPATPGHSRKEKPHPLRMGFRLKKKPGDDLLSRDSSTIGAEELNFRVRDGNGWDLFAMITRRLLQLLRSVASYCGELSRCAALVRILTYQRYAPVLTTISTPRQFVLATLGTNLKQ